MKQTNKKKTQWKRRYIYIKKHNKKEVVWEVRISDVSMMME
jgi:hypothetical protein